VAIAAPGAAFVAAGASGWWQKRARGRLVSGGSSLDQRGPSRLEARVPSSGQDRGRARVDRRDNGRTCAPIAAPPNARSAHELAVSAATAPEPHPRTAPGAEPTIDLRRRVDCIARTAPEACAAARRAERMGCAPALQTAAKRRPPSEHRARVAELTWVTSVVSSPSDAESFLIDDPVACHADPLIPFGIT